MRQYYYISGLIFSFLFMAACEKGEDIPQHYITPLHVYNPLDSSGNYAMEVLNHLYTFLPNGYNRINNVVLGAATDDAIASDNYNNIEILSRSRLNPVTDNPDGIWYEAYEAIRNTNLFLANIGKVPISSTLKENWIAEARFIRAINYFELIKRYGGVPLIGDQLFSQDEKLEMPRDTYEACVQYIVNEMDAIKDLLRPDFGASTDLGRITRGAALALKSRTLLYAASPLNNPSQDMSKWQDAAQAAGDLIDLSDFDLEGDFADVFTDRNIDEMILAYQREQTQDLERSNAPIGYAEPNQSNGYVSPTQELVNAFPMENGIPIDDPASGYDPQDPYSNRDPRMDATVFYNGSMWLGRPVETFEGGLDKPNGVQRQTRTGYYMRKFLADYSSSDAYGNQNHNFIIFRYAEILLNYAEAVNELGQTDIAYEQLKKIRDRAGIKEGDEGLYGLKPGMNKEEMREAVRLERRLELAFEEHRYWDIRRWKIAEQVGNRQLHGIRIVKDTDSTFMREELPVSEITFSAPKMYLYPIPFTETSGNLAMTQNPGWQN